MRGLGNGVAHRRRRRRHRSGGNRRSGRRRGRSNRRRAGSGLRICVRRRRGMSLRRCAGRRAGPRRRRGGAAMRGRRRSGGVPFGMAVPRGVPGRGRGFLAGFGKPRFLPDQRGGARVGRGGGPLRLAFDGDLHFRLAVRAEPRLAGQKRLHIQPFIAGGAIKLDSHVSGRDAAGAERRVVGKGEFDPSHAARTGAQRPLRMNEQIGLNTHYNAGRAQWKQNLPPGAPCRDSDV
jgi:hypothetical protein